MLNTLISRILIFITLLLTTSIVANTAEVVSIERPKEVIRHFQNGTVEEIYSQYDSAMAKLLPPHRMAPIWSQLLANYGEFIGFGLQDSTTNGDNLIINTDLDYEKAVMNFMLAVNTETNKITGIYFSEQEKKNINPEIAKPTPSYIDTSKFIESDIIIKDKFELNGKLTLPYNFDKKITFVLVHGSGPSDMDGTIGENKFLKNLAWGLSSIGYAVVRYEKVTKRYGRELMISNPEMTQDDEYNNSILGAIDLIKQNPKLSNYKIVLIGHSQGASAITSFYNNKDVAGMILLAGTPRKLYDLYTEQLEYIFNVDGIVRPSERTIIQEHKDKVSYFKNYKKGEVKTDSLPMGLNYEYLKHLDMFDPVKNLSQSGKPTLILGGSHDYQVTKVDFDIWKSNLEFKENIKFKYIENVNHIFGEIEKMAVPADYQKYTPIAPIVFDEINKWIIDL